MPARKAPSSSRAPRHDAVANGPAPDAASDAESPGTDVSAPVPAAHAVDGAATADPAADGATLADEAEDVPMNRAARRAKGKAAAQPRPIGKIVPGHVNRSHGPRSYSTRRSG